MACLTHVRRIGRSDKLSELEWFVLIDDGLGEMVVVMSLMGVGA